MLVCLEIVAHSAEQRIDSLFRSYIFSDSLPGETTKLTGFRSKMHEIDGIVCTAVHSPVRKYDGQLGDFYLGENCPIP